MSQIPNTDIVILPMDETTVEQVARIEALCFPDPWSLQSLRSELLNPHAHYFTALQGQAVLGYAGMYQVLDEGHITNVAVDPAHWRRGIAWALLEALAAFGESRRLCFLTLEVRASNEAAVTLYERHGFLRAGLRPGYYARPREDALIMTRYLRAH